MGVGKGSGVFVGALGNGFGVFVGGGAGEPVGSGLGVFVGGGEGAGSTGVFVAAWPPGGEEKTVGCGIGGDFVGVRVAMGVEVRVGCGFGVGEDTGVNVGIDVEVGRPLSPARDSVVGDGGTGVCVAAGVGGNWLSGTYPTIIAMGLGSTNFPSTQPDCPLPKKMRNHPPCLPVATTF